MEKNPKGINEILNDNRERIAELLPDYMSADAFIHQILVYASERRNDPKANILTCTQSSLLGAIFQAAMIGLRIGPEADILAYNKTIDGNTPQRKTVREANFQENYKGLLVLARRTGFYKIIDAEPVYKNDKPPITRKGSDFLFSFEPDYLSKDRGEAIAFYCYTETVDGGRDFTIMTAAQVETHRLQNAKGNKEKTLFWKKHPIPMSLKTVIRRHFNLKPHDDKLSLALHSGKVVNVDETTGSMTIKGEAVEPEAKPQVEDHSLKQLEGAISGESAAPRLPEAPASPAGDAPSPPEPANGKEKASMNYVRLLADIVDKADFQPAIRVLIEDGKIDDPRKLAEDEPCVLRTQEPAAAKLIYQHIQTANEFLKNQLPN